MFYSLHGHKNGPTLAAVFSPDERGGEMFASAGTDSQIMLWRAHFNSSLNDDGHDESYAKVSVVKRAPSDQNNGHTQAPPVRPPRTTSKDNVFVSNVEDTIDNNLTPPLPSQRPTKVPLKTRSNDIPKESNVNQKKDTNNTELNDQMTSTLGQLVNQLDILTQTMSIIEDRLSHVEDRLTVTANNQ